MATRAIVTSQPVVACDVCGRRLLRGETPDVFLAGGQRRTVCELCAPRAAGEGWMREADQHELSVRPARPRRRGSLFGRLRQLREGEGPLPLGGGRELGSTERQSAPRRRERGEEGLYEVEDPVYDFLAGGAGEDESGPGERAIYVGAVGAESSPSHSPASALSRSDPSDLAGFEPDPREDDGAGGPAGSEALRVARALELFNAGETPQRIAGVSRSLGAPSIVVRSLEGSDAAVAIVVAWELCWYRYEVDLGKESDGARLVAEGMELDELAPEDRSANALADERGRVELVGA